MDIGSTISVVATTVAFGLEAFRAFALEKDSLDKRVWGQDTTITKMKAQVKTLIAKKKTT